MSTSETGTVAGFAAVSDAMIANESKVNKAEPYFQKKKNPRFNYTETVTKGTKLHTRGLYEAWATARARLTQNYSSDDHHDILMMTLAMLPHHWAVAMEGEQLISIRKGVP